MHRAGKVVLAALRRAAGTEKPLDLLEALWPLIVGPRLAEHTRPVAWEKGWVEVAVGDRDWQEQLEHMTDVLRSRINRWWGTEIVEEITFTRSKVARKPAPESKRHKAAGTSLVNAKAEKPTRLTSEVRELKGELDSIRDPKLRELVGRVFRKYVAKKEGE